MKKIIMFVLFLILFTGTGYSAEILLNYKYNKKEQKSTPIEFVKVTKSSDEYKISYKLKGKIISEKSEPIEKQINTKFPFDSNTNEIYTSYDKYGNFMCKGAYYFKDDYSNQKIKFSFIFNDYNTIGSKKLSLRNAESIGVFNPAKISYQYNEQKNTFDVIQTIIYVAENGELTTKDIEIVDAKTDIITLKYEILYTQYYIRIREEEERIAEEKRKIELEEQRKLEEEERIAKEKKEKKLLAIAQKMKNWQNVSKYPENDIFEVFRDYFDGILDPLNYSIITIFNVEKNKNVWFFTTITQVLSDGFLCRTGNYYIYVQYKYTDGFVSEQQIQVYAKIVGTYTYKTIFGGTNTVPKVKAYFVKKHR